MSRKRKTKIKKIPKKMTQIDKGSIDYKAEVMRKSIHLFSLSMPIIYNFISTETAVMILFPLTLFSVIVDFGRFFIPTINNLVEKHFGFMMREHEKDADKKNLSGATYVFISALVSILILPKPFFILGFAVLILADIAAALIGRRFGRHKFLAKSLEGTTAFFVVGSIIVFFTPKLRGLAAEYYFAFIAVFIGAIVENISYGWADDNLTIPLSIGLSLWGLYALFLPQFNSQLSSYLINVLFS